MNRIDITFTSTYFQVREILSLWNDREYGGVATRHNLIQILQKNQKINSCQALISALEQKSKGNIQK